MHTFRAHWAASAALAALFLTGCRSGGLSTASWWPWKSSNNELATSAPVWNQPQLPSANTPPQNLTAEPTVDMTASTSVYPSTQTPGMSATPAAAMTPQQGPYAYTDPNAGYATAPPQQAYPSSYPAATDPAAAPYGDPAAMPATQPMQVADNRGLGASPYGNPAPAPAYATADPYAAAQPQGGYAPQSYSEPAAAPAPAGAYPASYNEPNTWPAPAPAPNYSQPAAYPAPVESQPAQAAPVSPYQQPAQAAPPSYGASAATTERPWRPGGTTDFVPRAGSNLAPAPQVAQPAGWNQPAAPGQPYPAGSLSTNGATLR